MKTLLVLYGLLALTWTLHVPIPQQDENKPSLLGVASQQSLHKQQIVLNLLQNVNKPGSVPEVEKVGLTYDIEANVENYKNSQAVVEFFKLYTTVALPKGQAFSIFNEQHRKEAIAFFKILQNAVDFDTLYKTAAWGTMFLNEGLYIYALSVALVHRQDTWTIRLPPIYEIYPNFFYNGGVLQQIEQKQQGVVQVSTQQGVNKHQRGQLQIQVPIEDSVINGVIIDNSQISSQQTIKSILSYFTEDVGLNAFYYYYNTYFPFWMTNEEISFNTERRGEQFYYICQQLLGRYNLERISNGLPEVPLLDMKTLTSSVKSGKQVCDNDTISLINLDLYETRLLDAIDSGFVLTRQGKMVVISTPQDFEMLGNVIQSNAESPNVRYYGNILGVATNVLKNIDSAHSETPLHDPIFYQLLKKITYYFQRYQEALPVYTEEQLLLPGVKIKDVAVDKLVTYFESFYTDVSGVVGLQGNSQNVPVQVKQTRLNHQPFNYNLNVLSEQPTEAIVKVFLGPKNDLLGNPIDINKNRLNFVELDKFRYSLVPGLNTIVRKCKQFIGYTPDQTTTKKIFAQLINFQTPVQNVPNVEWGIPQRLLLPKGTQEGQTYQIYVIITSSQSTLKPINRKVQLEQPTLYWDVIRDELPLGFPLDRPIDESVFYVPNSSFQDVVVYNDVNPAKGSKGQDKKDNPSLL